MNKAFKHFYLYHIKYDSILFGTKKKILDIAFKYLHLHALETLKNTVSVLTII